MKKKYNCFSHRGYWMHIIAGILIVCMLFADASLYLSLTSDNLPYANKSGDSADVSGNDFVVYENHLLDVAMADGIYDGNNSDSEHKDENIIESSEGKHLFSILEILPTEKRAVMGYTIGGCEPFADSNGNPLVGYKSGEEYIATPQQMREAHMDAVCNPMPGTNDANSINILNNNNLAKKFYQEMNGAFSDSGLPAFNFVPDKKYDGYYKYIGTNLGVYAEGPERDGDKVMYSKFYNYSSSRSYDYIFVYSDALSTNPKDINVKNHKRIKYTNNEKFIKEALGLSGDAVQEWKDDHVIEVVARTPISVTDEDIARADVIIVNNADSSTMRYYTYALNVYNLMHGKNESDDSNIKFGIGSNEIDFDDFEKVIRIYERVVVREDVAFVASRANMNGKTFDSKVRKLMCMLFFVYKSDDSRAGSGRDLFMNFIKKFVDEPGVEYMERRNQYEAHKNDAEAVRKLYPDYRAPSLRRDSYYNGIPYMHYYDFNPGHPLVKTAEEAITGGHYDESGHLVAEHDLSKVKPRTMKRKDTQMYTTDGLDYYEVSDSAGYKYRAEVYQSMSNATDYIYIDEHTGDLIRDDKYSGYWFNMDDDGNGDHQYKRIMWDKESFETWPWVEEPNGFKEWFYHISTTKSNYPYCEQGNLHLWFDYYQWGNYRAGNIPNGGITYKNQSLEAENGLFKDSLIKKALDGREVKREEDDPTHVIEKAKKDYYISMNILNGDGVNKNGLPGSNNKTLYYNQYEKDDIQAYETANGKARIPIIIRIKSSCKLLNIKVYDGSTGSVIATYPLNIEVTNENEINSSGGRGLKLTRPASSLDESGKPKDKTSGDGTMIHTFEGSIYDVMSSYYLNKRNEKIIVEHNAEAPDGSTKSIQDTITIVKRDFFMLD